jgi:hypothetical protein
MCNRHRHTNWIYERGSPEGMKYSILFITLSVKVTFHCKEGVQRDTVVLYSLLFGRRLPYREYGSTSLPSKRRLPWHENVGREGDEGGGARDSAAYVQISGTSLERMSLM